MSASGATRADLRRAIARLQQQNIGLTIAVRYAAERLEKSDEPTARAIATDLRAAVAAAAASPRE